MDDDLVAELLLLLYCVVATTQSREREGVYSRVHSRPAVSLSDRSGPTEEWVFILRLFHLKNYRDQAVVKDP